jgi:hypothetical protein
MENITSKITTPSEKINFNNIDLEINIYRDSNVHLTYTVRLYTTETQNTYAKQQKYIIWT